MLLDDLFDLPSSFTPPIKIAYQTFFSFYEDHNGFPYHPPSSTSNSETSSLLSPIHRGGATNILSESDEEKITFPQGRYGSVNSPEPEQFVSRTSSRFLQRINFQMTTIAKMGYELLREEIVVLLATLLFALTAQMILEVITCITKIVITYLISVI